MKKTILRKWGNSYAVRLPKEAVQSLNLKEGSGVSITTSKKERSLRITPTEDGQKSLAALVSEITPKNRHDIVDWGDTRGREVW